jgi:hypothetical protein
MTLHHAKMNYFWVIIIVRADLLLHKKTIHTYRSVSAQACHGSLPMGVLAGGKWTVGSNTCSP